MSPRQSKFIQSNLPVTSRAPINVIIAVIGLLQIACCAMVGLHLAGYFQVLETEREPSMGKTVKEPQHKYQSRVHKRQRHRTPLAHLPIRPLNPNGPREVYATIIHWNAERGQLSRLQYSDGRLLFRKPGVYYVYAKTCFRYYSDAELTMGRVAAAPAAAAVATAPETMSAHSPSHELPMTNQHNPLGHHHHHHHQYTQQQQQQHLAGVAMPTATPSPIQLIQYVFLERPSHGSPARPLMLMKTGSTQRWLPGGYHMSCQQQGGAVQIRAGDGLYVSVSNAWMLDPEAEGSYFGAFRITNAA